MVAFGEFFFLKGSFDIFVRVHLGVLFGDVHNQNILRMFA